VTSLDHVSVADMPEDLSGIEPCGPGHCGWNFLSDEGYLVSNIRELVDIVSTTDKASGQRISRFTSRATPDRIFTFLDRRGTFCEIMAGLCAGNIERTGSIP
jgi:hypothetical protein